jgi:hypothetical protein
LSASLIVAHARGLDGVACNVVARVGRGERATDRLCHLAGESEFFSVGDGCLRVPNPENAPVDGIKNIDWRGEVIGEVNCATGALNAEIRATYFVVSVCTLGAVPTRYFAKGPFLGVYNPDVDGFEDGTVTMLEPPVLLGDPPGGTGTWSAVREDARAGEAPSGPCLGDVVFDDSLFPSDDAGAP